MHIALIIHSQTGNTLSVAEKMKENLVALGHQVTLEKVEASNDEEVDATKVVLTSVPKIKYADAYIFGAPVRGFMLSAVMRSYLEQSDSLLDKPTICFLTQYFPFKWMGGNNAMKQFKEILSRKAGHIIASHNINWSAKKKRPKQIEEAVRSVELLLNKLTLS